MPMKFEKTSTFEVDPHPRIGYHTHMTNETAAMHLSTLNNLRHNFQMLKIVKSAAPDELRTLISKEMSLFCDASTLLCDGEYAKFADWFMANTDPDIASMLLMSTGMDSTPDKTTN